MIIHEYKGWNLITERQITLRCFPPWTTLARRKEGGKVVGFNAEGRTPQESMEKAHERIDDGPRLSL